MGCSYVAWRWLRIALSTLFLVPLVVALLLQNSGQHRLVQRAEAYVVAAANYIGDASFALTGSLAAGMEGMDLLGCVIVGFVTALGGGTIRDVFLGQTPIFWLTAEDETLLVIGVSVATFFAWPRLSMRYQLTSRGEWLFWTDALGLGVFAAVGAHKAARLRVDGEEVHFLGCAVCGMFTATFGGLTRDVLIGRPPRILYSHLEMYAIPALLGGASCAAFYRAGGHVTEGAPLLLSSLSEPSVARSVPTSDVCRSARGQRIEAAWPRGRARGMCRAVACVGHAPRQLPLAAPPPYPQPAVAGYLCAIWLTIFCRVLAYNHRLKLPTYPASQTYSHDARPRDAAAAIARDEERRWKLFGAGRRPSLSRHRRSVASSCSAADSPLHLRSATTPSPLCASTATDASFSSSTAPTTRGSINAPVTAARAPRIGHLDGFVLPAEGATPRSTGTLPLLAVAAHPPSGYIPPSASSPELGSSQPHGSPEPVGTVRWMQAASEQLAGRPPSSSSSQPLCPSTSQSGADPACAVPANPSIEWCG